MEVQEEGGRGRKDDDVERKGGGICDKAESDLKTTFGCKLSSFPQATMQVTGRKIHLNMIMHMHIRAETSELQPFERVGYINGVYRHGFRSQTMYQFLVCCPMQTTGHTAPQGSHTGTNMHKATGRLPQQSILYIHVYAPSHKIYCVLTSKRQTSLRSPKHE